VERGEEMTNSITEAERRAVLLAQYKEVCEDYRACDRLAWQIPSLIIAIGGTLIVVSFAAMATAPVPARILVLGIALLLIVGMSFILLRHRYFQAIAVGTLSQIEKQLESMHIQRTPLPSKYDERDPETELYPRGLLYPLTPGSILRDGTPGPQLLFPFMLIMAFGVAVLMVYICIQHSEPWAWGIFIGSIIATTVTVALIKKSENERIAKAAKKPAETKKARGRAVTDE
jgi:hypothetical protein